MEYVGIKGTLNGINTTVIDEIAQYYRSIGTPIPARYPLVGADFNKTRAGIHAGGLASDERIYNIFDTTTLLNRPVGISITDKSGADGVALWVNNFLGLHNENRIRKTKLVRIMRWVTDQYDVEKRTTAISDEEMAALVKEHLPKQHEEAQREGRLTTGA